MALDIEALQRQAREIAAASAGRGQQFVKVNRYKMKGGSNILRFMPCGSMLAQIVALHYNLPPNGKGMEICLEHTFPELGVKCEMCAGIDECYKAIGDPKMAEPVVGNFKASSRGFTNVIDRTNEAAGPLLAGLPIVSVLNPLVTEITKPEYAPILDISDPVQGCDIIITKTGTTKMDTRYAATIPLNSIRGENGMFATIPIRSPLHPDKNIMDKWLASMYNVSSIYPKPEGEAALKAVLTRQATIAILIKDKVFANRPVQVQGFTPPVVAQNVTAPAPNVTNDSSAVTTTPGAPQIVTVDPAKVFQPAPAGPVLVPQPVVPQTPVLPSAPAPTPANQMITRHPMPEIKTGPDGRPECYAKADQYVRQSTKCMVCPVEPSCSQAITLAK